MASHDVIEEDLTANGDSAIQYRSEKYGEHSLSISDTFSGVVTFYRSFDGGVTWLPVKVVTSAEYEGIVVTVENGVAYKFTMSSYVSGTASVRLGV